MEKILKILIININNLAYTKKLVYDLSKQTVACPVLIVDQGSTEAGTHAFFDSLPFKVIKNNTNVSISKVWNDFYLNSEEKYLCFLNNDIRVPLNFIEDTITVLDNESTVGCAVHSTNHPDYTERTKLNYVLYENNLCQGWDFTIRREAYALIPSDIGTFGGDDYLFYNMYKNGWKTAMLLSSPIVHYHAKSRKHYNGNRKTDACNLKKYVDQKMVYYTKYSRRSPCRV